MVKATGPASPHDPRETSQTVNHPSISINNFTINH